MTEVYLTRQGAWISPSTFPACLLGDVVLTGSCRILQSCSIQMPVSPSCLLPAGKGADTKLKSHMSRDKCMSLPACRPAFPFRFLLFFLLSVCIHACMCAFAYICITVQLYTIFICIHRHVSVVCIYTCVHFRFSLLRISIYMYVCMYVGIG